MDLWGNVGDSALGDEGADLWVPNGLMHGTETSVVPHYVLVATCSVGVVVHRQVGLARVTDLRQGVSLQGLERPPGLILGIHLLAVPARN